MPCTVWSRLRHIPSQELQPDPSDRQQALVEAVAAAAETADIEAEQTANAALSAATASMSQLASPRKSRAQSDRNRDRDLEMAALRDKGLTLHEIGDRYGLSRERVRQCLTRCNMTGWMVRHGMTREQMRAASTTFVAAREQPLEAARKCLDELQATCSDEQLIAALHSCGAYAAHSKLQRARVDSQIALGLSRGEEFRALAARLDYSEESIRRRASNMGLYRRRRRLGVPRAANGLHPLDETIAARRGLSAAAVARELGVCDQYVRSRRKTC